jgi:phosphoglycolate phosphatase
MSRRFVIFDFDGTLADSFPWFVEAFDQAALRFGFQRLDRERLDDLRARDARHILLHHRIAPWKVPFVAHFLRQHMAREISRISLFPGMGAALETLAGRGLQLALLTSNSYPNVTRVLGPRASCFAELECSVSLFGKTSRLRRLLAGSGVAPHEAIFIGDEVRDAEAARHVGVAFGAVSWGYTRLPSLEVHSPLLTFETIDELVAKLTPAAAGPRGTGQ